MLKYLKKKRKHDNNYYINYHDYKRKKLEKDLKHLQMVHWFNVYV